MLTTGTIQEGLKTANNLLTRELRAMMQLVNTAPMSMKREIAEKLPEFTESLQTIEAAFDHVADVEQDYQEMQKKCDVHLRWQMHWRILAMKAALGLLGPEGLKAESFKQFITEPRPEHELADELHDLVERLENFESAEEDLGPLRSIQLDPEK